MVVREPKAGIIKRKGEKPIVLEEQEDTWRLNNLIVFSAKILAPTSFRDSVPGK